METAAYGKIARTRWRWLVGGTAVGLLGSILYLLLATPIYSATAEVMLITNSGDSAGDLVQGGEYAQNQVRSFSAVATREVVLQPVIEQLGLDTTARELAATITVNSPLNTAVISITASSEDPDQAAAIANAVAQQLTLTVPELSPRSGAGDSRVQLRSIQEAVAPTRPSSPDVKIWLAIGLVGGVSLGIAAAAMREASDTKVRTADDVVALSDSPLLGRVAFDATAIKHPVLTGAEISSPRGEMYRHIRTGLRFLSFSEKRVLIALTSSLPGEGKSLTSVNLAMAMAAAGDHVCLVEADLRRPNLAKYTGQASEVGLTSVLVGATSLDESLQRWGRPAIDVLFAGERPPNPSEMLGSPAFRDLLHELSERYDTVIVDCAPLLPVTDGALAAKACGGSVLVIGSGVANRTDVTDSLNRLDTIGVPVLGTILNMDREIDSPRYNYQSA